MKFKTSELIDKPLDWAVAQGAQLEPIPNQPIGFYYWNNESGLWTPSTNWAQGGPIIERERIQLKHRSYDTDPWWVALIDTPDTSTSKTGCVGPAPLIAAMRCYVASKLGDEVEVPDELVT